MVNPTYCTKALRRGICTESSCLMRHDISRCELCDCSFPHASLFEHQNGKQHLRNAASTGPQPSTPSQLTPIIRSAPPATIPLPVGVNIPACDTDPRVNVSSEGGLYFFVEGSGTPGIPLFSFANRNILIEKTDLSSSLSIQSVALTPPLDSCFTATLIGKETAVHRKKAREIVVSFHPSRVGSFYAVLEITFSDKGRRNNREFTVARELRARAILPDGLAISGDVEGAEEGGGAGITVTDESGLEFLVERSDMFFPMQTRELVITKTSAIPVVFFRAAKISSLHDSVASWFSARLEGSSKWIKQNHERKVAVCFMPQQEGRCEAVLELTFWDHERMADFVIRRTLSGQAKESVVRQGLLQLEYGPNTAPQPINDRVDNDPRIIVDEESLDCDGTGVSVSHVDGLDFGIVERKCPNGLFETPSAVLNIKHEDDFPPVMFVEGRAKGGDRDFRTVIDSERDSLVVRPGSECRVRITFSPKYEGLFKSTLELIFYHTELSVYFVVRRALQGIAGSLEDHKHFDSLGQEDDLRTIESREAPPRKTILLSSPDQRRRSRYLPNYKLPPIVQEALDRSTVTHPYEEGAPGLMSALRPDGLNISTYAHHFNALLAVDDGYQQWDVMCQPTYEVDVKGCGGHRYSIEIENSDEDLLPEVALGDFLWLDDIHDDIRYEARVTNVDVFTRHHLAVLKVSLRLPTAFSLYVEAQFKVRSRLNRIALRRQYHGLMAAVAPPRRLLFPSLSDIRPKQRLSRAEIDNLKFRQLANRDIRDDSEQLQAVISILEQPPGSVPFIVYGPPGTGKTSIVVESVVQLVRRDAGVRVLVCTPSNAVADLLAESLAAAGLDSDKLYRLDTSSLYEEDIFGDVEAMSLFPGLERLLAFRVILSTCSSASMLRALDVPVGHFSHIVIDEAAQAEEPLAMIPIMGFSDAYTNIILAGDPNQLGPIIKSPTAARAGLGKSYLKRLMLMDEVYGLDTQAGKAIVALHRNHRSHSNIIAWSNRYFYEDTMRDYGNSFITCHLVLSDVLPKKGFPVVFHGVKGNEQHAKWSPSYFNIIEASIVRDYCVKLIGDRERMIYPEEIGVLAPYKTQVRAIRELLKAANLSDISVGPVEQFQGQERKVIILATTRSNEESHPRNGLGFLINRQRTNVAITRAQALLIVIGDPEILRKDKLWRIFLNYIESREGWAGKVHSWKPDEAVHLPEYEIVPEMGGIMYGGEFIGGKSEKIRRSLEGTGG